jgi:hypothetical protein
VLLVAKVGQPDARQGCTVGLVLATGNPQANEQARRIADDQARSFECGTDERVTKATFRISAASTTDGYWPFARSIASTIIALA